MDCTKIGVLISKLRSEKNYTQQNIADALNISNKTVSKWECGLGCPDVSLWPELSVILGVDIKQLIEGEITQNLPDAGNMQKVRFYVCPTCKNILFSTGSSSIFCCGRKAEHCIRADGEHTPKIMVSTVDTDYYIKLNHEMTKEHYLLFAAYVKSDSVHFCRLYPEQDDALRLPCTPGGTLYLYCVKHGLSAHEF